MKEFRRFVQNTLCFCLISTFLAFILPNGADSQAQSYSDEVTSGDPNFLPQPGPDCEERFFELWEQLDDAINAQNEEKMQCLRDLNSKIQSCLDGWSSWIGRLDECVGKFDQEHPNCAPLGISGAQVANEVRDAYGEANIIFNVGDIIASMVSDLAQCGCATLSTVAYLHPITLASIYSGAGDPMAWIPDECVNDDAQRACLMTAINAGVMAAAAVAPVAVLTGIGGMMAIEHAKCHENCSNTREFGPSLEACYDQCRYQTEAEILTILILAKGFKALTSGEKPILPPDFVKPEFPTFRRWVRVMCDGNCTTGGGAPTTCEVPPRPVLEPKPAELPPEAGIESCKVVPEPKPPEAPKEPPRACNECKATEILEGEWWTGEYEFRQAWFAEWLKANQGNLKPPQTAPGRAPTQAGPFDVIAEINSSGQVSRVRIYDQNGRAIADIDFTHDGVGPGHLHVFDVPGQPGTGHGQGQPHIKPGDNPANRCWLESIIEEIGIDPVNPFPDVPAPPPPPID